MDICYAFVVVYVSTISVSARKFPQNVAVLIGQSVILNCQTELTKSVWWIFKSSSNVANEMFIFKDGNLSDSEDRYVVNATQPGQFDLLINSTRLSDAGTYGCVEVLGNAAVSHYSELIVFDSVPECGTNLTETSTLFLDEYDSLLMWCFAEFRGNLNPVMEWKSGTDGEQIHSRTDVISNKNIYSEIVVQVKQSEDEFLYSCTTHFNQTSFCNLTKNFNDRLHTIAKNIPDYSYMFILGKTNGNAVSTIPSTVQVTGEFDRNPFTTTSTATSVNVGLVIWMIIVSLATLVLLCIAVTCCTLKKKSNTGRPVDRISESLTPANQGQVGMLPADQPSYCPAIGDTYCKLNIADCAPIGIYSALVSAGESAMYVNIQTLDMPLQDDIIVPHMAPASAALGNAITAYENTAVITHYMEPETYNNTKSEYENTNVSQ